MKFVLCRPIGGLNDMLNQIEKCCRYADTHDRIVLVQTNERTHRNFQLPLSDYFISLHDRLRFVDYIDPAAFDGLSIFPSSLAGRLDSYGFTWQDDLGFFDVQSGDFLSFDFQKDYDEDILVHHQAGGGKLSVAALSRIRIHDSVIDLFLAKLALMSPPYAAAHVRHTDIQSDYSRILEEVANQNYNKLFLATDNKMILREFKSRLENTIIYNFSDLPKKEGKPVHLQMDLTKDQRHVINQQAIIDLLLLASSSTLHTNDRLWIVRPKENYQIHGMGYSGLARALQENSALRQGLIQRPLDVFENRDVTIVGGSVVKTSDLSRKSMETPKLPPLFPNAVPEVGVRRELTSLTDILEKIHPIKTQHNLIRLGGNHDGGYLVPDDLQGISACFSPGVGGTSSFEADLYNFHNIASHLAAGTVQSPPSHPMMKSFTKLDLAAVGDETNMTLETWITNHMDRESDDDLLLQMDIEGAEYPVLLSTPIEILRRFRIMVIEFHGCPGWASGDRNKTVTKIFEKIENLFHVVHSHPNNCCGIATVSGFEIPRVVEITFLRKDRAEMMGYCQTFPHPLDRPNLKEKPDLILPQDCYHKADK